MDECDLEPEQTQPRHVVDELCPGRRQLAERLLHVVRLERDVMHPRPPSREEATDVCVLANGRDELDSAVADEERRGVDTLLAKRVTTFEPGSEEPPVHGDSLVQIGHRDAEVVDAADVHPSDAT